MPAMRSVQGREEMDVTRDEGIGFTPGWGPKRIVGEHGRATGIELIRCERVFDEQGRFSPSFAAGSEWIMPADTILLAIGQRSDYSFLRPEDGIELTPARMIKVDPETLATTAPGVFAGGDGAFPPGLLITAAEHGKRAAASIDAYLQGERRRPMLRVVVEEQPLSTYRMPESYEQIERHVPVVPVDRRTGITEVEACYTESEAKRQADRCLSCHVHPIYNRDLCVLCARCADICPENCISFVALEALSLSAGDAGAVAAIAPADQTHTAFLYAEDRCIRCALCAIRCPTGAITMERFRFEELIDAAAD
jgi:formate dehydrogenase beta subunit